MLVIVSTYGLLNSLLILDILVEYVAYAAIVKKDSTMYKIYLSRWSNYPIDTIVTSIIKM